ncbi:SMI1/KNR4 family protein [Bacillus inaquosorum]|uniref:SMI1/KNR4 family protein n=1 Tax=Bacillus inaquosorum TaxID=483913 RepID=UPI0022815228|nr:SMI1/KNR4 family protein [Bacillus inaquosorum]MCY7943559.1 SMI1/KNR4 family protein [Bacillus inaquosorum]MCY7985446.1 SMI1/KNR4 family protein [Bacillus inaquosorum]MCY8177442.1 SMI1/KNR4 family protein [Bacillus inaquosorum]MCY8250864.1 SMI1/KNR4 family protein [Bacillus inaquosorum]MCY8298576.1 SMI1/KNR4 family protein [Bacillus inaquosorum]
MAVFIEKTLNGLKELIDEKGRLKILRSRGNLAEVECTFSKGATDQEIALFEKKINVSLPNDYKAFLKLHNGARIFESLINGENVGGGLHILNLEEIERSMQNDFLEPQFIPIAHLLDGCYLLIDKTKISTDPNYLWFHGLIEYEPMQLNFEIFLDRYILSQGSNFWDWGIYTAENYYRTHRVED